MRQYKEKNIDETGENQSTLHLLQNESVLSKYLMVHE